MTIIGCMAAYQEGENIARALASLAPLCDRIIVVDGAQANFPLYDNCYLSTDETLHVAWAFGAEIVLPPKRPWRTQIEQRNAYLLGAPGDWYLICDADEVASGTLPDLEAPEGAYIVHVRDRIDAARQQIRMVREDGTLRYQFTHYGLYRQGKLIDYGKQTGLLEIDNTVPRTPDRWDRRMAWTSREHSTERARSHNGRMPELWQPDDELPPIAFRYTGAGLRYIPGIPARDILVSETKHHGVVEANLRTRHPVYERVPC